MIFTLLMSNAGAAVDRAVTMFALRRTYGRAAATVYAGLHDGRSHADGQPRQQCRAAQLRHTATATELRLKHFLPH
jgi:hypothetical protein